jgi:nucleoside phosphorylase
MDPAQSRPHQTAVILTALDVESSAVTARLASTTTVRLGGGTRYVVGRVLGAAIDWTVAVAEVGEGNIGAAVEATNAIRELQPNVLMFVGVAGGLKDDVAHGSVVVANRVYSYQSGKAADQFQARPIVFPTWHSLDQLVRTVRRTKWTAVDPVPRVYLKPIAAGERVVASVASEDFKILREHYSDAAAIDMESAGLYLAAERNNRTPTIAVRGISDKLSDKSTTSDEKWQPIAAANAAAFAIALLNAADPSDMALTLPRIRFTSELAERLSRLPSPVAALIEQAIADDSVRAVSLVDDLLRAGSVKRVVEEVALSYGDVRDPRLLAAIGEYAMAHGMHDVAASAFDKAGTVATDEGPRWFVRSSLAYAAADMMDLALQEIALADKIILESSTSRNRLLVEVAKAAVHGDPAAIVSVAGIDTVDDPLISLIVMQALGATGRLDQAIGVGRRTIEESSSRSITGGLALILGRLLVQRTEDPTEATNETRDLLEAEELGLRVRDVRRRWNGASWEGVHLAMVAAFKSGDIAAALEYGRSGPKGTATSDESAQPAVRSMAANAAIAARDFALASELAKGVTVGPERTFLLAEIAIASGTHDEAAVADLTDLLTRDGANLDEAEQFRGMSQLAELGVWPLPNVQMKDAEAAEIVLARAETVQGRVGDAVRRLRRLVTLRGRTFLVGTLVASGRTDEAIAVLRDGAARFRQPRLKHRAALLLGRTGRYEEARVEAEAALALVDPRSHLAQQLRELVMEASSKLRDWATLVTHADSAVNTGHASPEMIWASIWGTYNQRNLDESRRRYWRSKPKVRDEDDAILVVQLLRTGTPDRESLEAVLDLADDNRGSERVMAVALMAAIEMSRSIDLPTDVVDRLRSLQDMFFETWPSSRILYRIDASDVNNVVDHIRDALSPRADMIADVAAKVQVGDMPYGLLAFATGRSVTEALIKVGAGAVAAGEPSKDVIAAEDGIAAAAADLTVVMDASAFVGALRSGIEPDVLTAAFGVVSVGSSTLDDALTASDALRLRSTATMGWDPRANKPVFSEVDVSVAEAWAADAELIVQAMRRASVNGPITGAPTEQQSGGSILDPIYLAKQLGCPLWSDERAMRVLARSEGVPAFGTINVVALLNRDGAIGDAAVVDARLALLRAGFLDYPLLVDDLVRLAQAENWSGVVSSQLIARPSAWLEPQLPLDLYKRAIGEAISRDPSSLGQWAYSASMGTLRRTRGRIACELLPTLLLLGLSVAAMDAKAFASLVAGVRAAAEALACSDPLRPAAAQLARSLREAFAGPVATKVFTDVIAELIQEDRMAAFEEFVRGE